MSAPATRASCFGAKIAGHAWWLLLLAALGLHALATDRRIARVDALTDSPTWSVDAPPRDAQSPTGFANGQRKLVVPGHHSPSFWWIIEAQRSVEEGKLRLRHIDYDAAPDGREIRRTALYRWWLIAVGWLHAVLHGEPLGYSIERGALLADPLLYAVLLIGGAVYTARFSQPRAAVGFVVGAISLFPLAANFQPGAPDPHALGWVLALGSVLPLVVPTGRTDARPRLHFIAAGIFGGLGFWNDAAMQMPVLLACVIAGIGSALARSRAAGAATVAAAPWRAWALAGALTTLGASVFEFAPDHFTWSLDSVNPIHALGWWGAGEMLRAAERYSRDGRKSWSRQSIVWLALGAVAFAAWPVIGSITDSGGLLATDFYARELANHPRGGIAANFSAWLAKPGNAGAEAATLLSLGIVIVAVARMWVGKPDAETRGRWAFLLLATGVVVVLAVPQLRYWNLLDVFLLALISAIFADTVRKASTPFWTTAAALSVLPGLFVGFPRALKADELAAPSPLEAQALIARDFSYWLSKRGAGAPHVVAATPIFSDAVAFYGGFDVVVSSDPTNEAGNLTAVRIASATTEQEASVLLNSRGITHLALPLWDPMVDQLVRLGSDAPPGQPLPREAFFVSLRDWGIPVWMRPLDYLIPNEPRFQGMELRAFALQAEQEPELAMSRLADLFVERGQLREAESLRQSLEPYSRSVAALGAIANVDLALRDAPRLERTLERLIPLLSRRAARDLPADRRISLAALFLQVKRAELAREQITACIESLEAETLRTLTPGSVINLVALSRSLRIPFPNPDLEDLAQELIPPAVRERLAQ